MKNWLLLFFFICFRSVALTQDTIPLISEQPLWFIPIYFEEGGGQSDTIYLGYDERADIQSNFDTLFGRIDSVINNEFHAFARYIFNNEGMVTNISESANNMNTDVSFINGVFPFKITWDYSKMYTTSLPESHFPDLGLDTPRIKIFVEAIGQNVQPFYDNNSIIYLSDTSLGNGYSHFEDSVIVGNEFSGLPIDNATGLSFNVVRKNYLSTSIDSGNNFENSLLCFPNPVKGVLRISLKDEINFGFITNIHGEKLVWLDDFSQIDVSSLSQGVYFLSLYSNTNRYIKKIVKN